MEINAQLYQREIHFSSELKNLTFYKLSCINREVILGYNRLSKRGKSAKNAGKQKLLP